MMWVGQDDGAANSILKLFGHGSVKELLRLAISDMQSAKVYREAVPVN
jgi:hypothetical protein